MKNRKNTSINNTIIGMVIFIIAIFCSCSNNKEVPERQTTTTKRYVLPTPQPLNDAEREFINNKRNEYLKAIE